MSEARGWVIFFFGKKPKEPEVIEDFKLLLSRLHEIAKTRALHAVYVIGDCVGKFS